MEPEVVGGKQAADEFAFAVAGRHEDHDAAQFAAGNAFQHVGEYAAVPVPLKGWAHLVYKVSEAGGLCAEALHVLQEVFLQPGHGRRLQQCACAFSHFLLQWLR